MRLEKQEMSCPKMEMISIISGSEHSLFSKEIEEFIDAHEKVFVIEQNRDGQLLKLLKTETSCNISKLKSIRLYNGIPIFSKDVVEKIMNEISSGKAA